MVDATEVRDILSFVGYVVLGILAVVAFFRIPRLAPVAVVSMAGGTVLWVYFLLSAPRRLVTSFGQLCALLVIYFLVWLYSVGLVAPWVFALLAVMGVIRW